MKKTIFTVVLVIVLVFNLFAFSYADSGQESDLFLVETSISPRLTYQINVSGIYTDVLYCNGGQIIANNHPGYYKYISVDGYTNYTVDGTQAAVFVPYYTYGSYAVKAICATSVNYPDAGFGGSATAYFYAP